MSSIWTRFELTQKRSADPVASLTVRDMGPPSPDLPGPAAGIIDLFVCRRTPAQGGGHLPAWRSLQAIGFNRGSGASRPTFRQTIRLARLFVASWAWEWLRRRSVSARKSTLLQRHPNPRSFLEENQGLQVRVFGDRLDVVRIGLSGVHVMGDHQAAGTEHGHEFLEIADVAFLVCVQKEHIDRLVVLLNGLMGVYPGRG